ncbi:class I tRNA ligase family protein, partial [Patescibacteria group bacterium]
FGYYLTGKSPFKDVYLHGHVRALDGKKMSKSLGNVINPEEYMEEFGVDALRMGLIAGTANGKDFNFPRDKVVGYRNFANKIWNIARFMNMMVEDHDGEIPFYTSEMNITEEDKEILNGLDSLITQVNSSLEKYRFADAGEAIYQFVWHELADKYIESVKDRDDKDVALSVLRHIFLNCLKLLHPFMPFVTEEIWQNIPRKYDEPLIVSDWPQESKKPADLTK